MNTEREVRLFGRRFVLSTRATYIIAALSVLAFITVIVRPESAMYVASILSAAVLGIGGGAAVFTGGESAVDFKHGKKEVATETVKTETTTERTTPVARPSVTVLEPPNPE